ncbi:acetylcholine receptor subunit alpha-type unc-63-like [Teleopsis dalmanni]|uniref:acetylcholine receptor subunit alpha-type unc-63-like n=1 Tax=Teleopsis dalmanni TaxID=139649 RepID=UPI0018CF5EC4|nr:acetylcholine receptor subunit alpha-type unc-63-like [Teleopsis dalmanni]
MLGLSIKVQNQYVQTWKDENRTWNELDYGNITRIHVRSTSIWTPSIVLFNAAGDSSNHMGSTQVMIYSDGSCLWVPPVTYTVFCHLNFKLWPYDLQKCTLLIGTWIQTVIDPYSGTSTKAIQYEDLIQSIEWEIVSSKWKFHNTDNHLEMMFTLQRRSTMYAAVIFIPASCIVLLALSTFWLPSQMGEKILLNGLVIIVIAIFLMYFAQLLPVMAESTPLIVMFYISSLLMVTFSTIISTIVLYLSTSKHEIRLPVGIKKLMDGTIRQVLLLPNFTLGTNTVTIMKTERKELDDHIFVNQDVDIPNPNWMDDKCTWDKEVYDNIIQLHLKPSTVWKPEIMLFNSADDNSDYVGDTQVLLDYDGEILWVPPVIYTAYCYLNFKMWPYDTQKCTLKIGSWTQTLIDRHILSSPDGIDSDDVVKSIEWEIVSTKAESHHSNYNSYVQIDFELRRRSTMYAAVICIPAFCNVLLALSTFWLPPQMGEKFLLNGLLIIVIAIFLMYFVQFLPLMAGNTPLIAVVLYMSTAKHERRLPTFIKNALDGTLSQMLLLSKFTLEVNTETMVNSDTEELGDHINKNQEADYVGIIHSTTPLVHSIQFDWILLATAVDHIMNTIDLMVVVPHPLTII